MDKNLLSLHSFWICICAVKNASFSADGSHARHCNIFIKLKSNSVVKAVLLWSFLSPSVWWAEAQNNVGVVCNVVLERQHIREREQNLQLFYVHVSLPPLQNVCPHLRLHSFRGGNFGIKERVFAYAACCLQEREQSKKKDVRGGQRERGQILHCGVGGRKGLSELGSGWKLTEKDFRLVPRGDKSLGISPWKEPENGREEQHSELRGLFLLTMKRKFVFPKSHPTFLLHATKKHTEMRPKFNQLVLHESTFVARVLTPFYLLCFSPNQFYCMFH